MRLDFATPSRFQERLVPPGTRLVGWAGLVHGLSIQAPVRRPSCVSKKHIRGSHRVERNWIVFDKRYWSGDDFADHLKFALRHEELDLLILKRTFDAVPRSVIEDFVRATPTGIAARRAWFLYEKLTGCPLDVPDAGPVSAVDLLDPKAYFTAQARLSKRHRVRDNLLGSDAFCPIIRRTRVLEEFIALGLAEKIRQAIGNAGSDLVARAASFMLLADSRASFAIEGERPASNRLRRWGHAVQQAGNRPLNQTEIYRLHRILIEDDRHTPIGYRTDRTAGVFLGGRDPFDDPCPEFIGARPEDVVDLMNGLNACNNRMRRSDLDPVLQAAALAFGFVYIHPLQDGNGRLQRCLVHHVLAERGFTPPGMVFPVSSVMLDRIDEYQATLRAHSRPLMAFVEWRPTPDRNVEVLNDTADLYRYFDCTEVAEFLYACVSTTVEHSFPKELDYLRRHDEAVRRIMDAVEMPDRLAQDLTMFIHQNKGTLAKRRRRKEFKALTDDEVVGLERIVREAFTGFDNATNG